MEENCIFCKIADGEIPSKTLYEDDMFRVILDINPASKGHALILTKKHFKNIYEMDNVTASEVFVLAKRMAKAMTEALGCNGFNIVQNNGEVAGQTVFHFHLHLIPRYTNDGIQLNMEGKEVGKIDLNDAVFGVEVNEHLVHMAVVQQLANKRQGTQKAKTRSEVRGGGKKPWRQKGTGHARQGSIRAPQWKGGGVVFAPKPRDYSFKLNKKEKRAALKSALTSRVNESKFIVVDDLKLDGIKTKRFQEVLNNLKVNKALVILNDNDESVMMSARNIPAVKTALTNTINVYDIMKYDTVVVTKDAVATIEEVYA